MDLLWTRIRQLEGERLFDGRSYPEGLTAFPGRLDGQGFFGGGDGLWRDNPADIHAYPFPTNGIMVLGNDFGCLDNPDPRSPGFLQCLARGYEEPPTWRIKDTIKKAGIKGTYCFFTNAYLGLRTNIRTTGPSPGASNNQFKAMCTKFFAYQMQIQMPRMIICLGHEPRLFVAPLLFHSRHIWSRKLSFNAIDEKCNQVLQGSFQIGGKTLAPVVVVIAHPSFAWSTWAQSPRAFQEKRGEEAEVALLANAWAVANQKGD